MTAPDGVQRAADGSRPDAAALSVITVTYGRLDLLMRKARALTEQTLAPERFEWCVVANGDAEAAAWLAAARTPFALRALPLTAKGPVAAARNLAAASARGDFLLLSDDDVLPAPGCLEAHLQAHAALSANVPGGSAPPPTVVIGDLHASDEHRLPGAKEPFEQRLLQRGAGLWINVTGANTSLPRAAFSRLGGFDEAFAGYGGEDSDLGFRLRAAGARFVRSAAASATHVGSVLPDTDKAFAAGRAGVRVWRKHRSLDAALMLGVHPLLLRLKRLWLRTPGAHLMSAPRLAYERAYLQGAEQELRAPADGPLARVPPGDVEGTGTDD